MSENDRNESRFFYLKQLSILSSALKCDAKLKFKSPLMAASDTWRFFFKMFTLCSTNELSKGELVSDKWHLLIQLTLWICDAIEKEYSLMVSVSLKPNEIFFARYAP